MSPALAQRVGRLAERFRDIAATRMQGVALCHPLLEVAAVGFEPVDQGRAAVGVLITPWFMNLVRLPLATDDVQLPLGASRTHALGHERFDFIGAHEDGIGPFEACSLFSPMHDFTDQAAAIATAEAVLSLLRPAPAPAAEAPARRRFLLGRSGAAA
ncbi:MAG: [NiFe]-hydrogenase assembly chaperone HybE [Rubrivivax sp.]